MPNASLGTENDTSAAMYSSSLFFDNPAWKAAGLVFIAAIAGIGLAGNAVVILLLCKHHSLRNSINACVGNIAVCDILVCVLILPLVFAQRLTGGMLLGNDVCLLSGCGLFVCIGVANSSFALIGLNRYVFVLHQALYHRCLEGPGHAAVRVIVNWALWLVLSGVVYSQHAFHFVRDSSVCFFGDDDLSNVGLAVFVMLAMVTVPSAVAGFCYCSVLAHVMASRRRVRDMMTNDRQLAEQRKLARSLASVILNYLLFNLLWLPYFCHVTFGRFIVIVEPVEHNVIVWLALCSCSVKPLLQLTLNGEFQRRLAARWLSCCCCAHICKCQQSAGLASSGGAKTGPVNARSAGSNSGADVG